LILATFPWRLKLYETMKEKVMNDEILIELGDVSEETKGVEVTPGESIQQPDFRNKQ
jgi:hypothetical protein